MKRKSRGSRRHERANLTRALNSMSDKNESRELEIHPLMLLAGVLLTLYLVVRVLRTGIKLPGVTHMLEKPELVGE